MINVDIKSVWLLGTRTSPPREIPILGLLQGINETGKLTQGARKAGLSYRHAWDLLEQWEQFLGNPLVEKQRGRGVSLTPLGEKLLWAEKRVKARLAAQLINLASELETEINRVLSHTDPLIRLHASHGYAIGELREALHRDGQARLDLQYRGGLEALVDLSRGECDLAGFHVPEGGLEARALELFRPWIHAANYQLIHFARRRQGLIVRRGNPDGITGLADLVRPGLRFVNRESSSGTRMLFDMLLTDAGVAPDSIPGYQKEELTHNAVAALIASGMADVGFGVEAAARQFDLGFIPIASEQYYLMCREETLARPGMQDIIRILGSEDFRTTINAIPGYHAPQSGQVDPVSKIFPHLR